MLRRVIETGGGKFAASAKAGGTVREVASRGGKTWRGYVGTRGPDNGKDCSSKKERQKNKMEKKKKRMNEKD